MKITYVINLFERQQFKAAGEYLLNVKHSLAEISSLLGSAVLARVSNIVTNIIDVVTAAPGVGTPVQVRTADK